MAYPRGMTGPHPSFTPSRLNVGGYGVRVVWQERMTGWQARRMHGWGESTAFGIERLGFHITQSRGVGGTVTSDGSLTVKPEPWAARHYRRAVMAGAGVYRLGLWAFLAAGRGYTFTAPAPGASAQPYRVKIEGEAVAHTRGRILYPVSRAEAVKMRGSLARLGRGLIASRMTARGTIGADGTLSIHRNGYRAAHFKRVMLRGSDVYLAGLWAHLSAHQAPNSVSSPLDWAALRGVMNAAPVFSLGRGRPPSYNLRYVQRWEFKSRGKHRPIPLKWKDWKSSTWGREGLTSWATVPDSFRSRLICARGVWDDVVRLCKLDRPVVRGHFLNTSREYLGRLGGHTLSRVRSTSPRWRGTAGHKREARTLIPLAMRGEGWTWSNKHGWKYPTRKAMADKYHREVMRAGGPAAWAKDMVRLLDASGNAPAMRRDVNKRLRALAVYYRDTLAQVLAAFRDLRVTSAGAAFALLWVLARAAYREACKLGRAQRPRRAPRPPCPLARPRPPTAPLAPPAL